jgi:hypothetical protein
MKHTLKITLLMISFFIPMLSYSASIAFEWGGPGLDTPSLFLARAHGRDPKKVEILVDHKDTYKFTDRMIITNDEEAVPSDDCYKAYRHPEAPFACIFDKEALGRLSDPSRIEVYNSGNILLEGDVDMKQLNAFVDSLNNENIIR